LTYAGAQAAAAAIGSLEGGLAQKAGGLADEGLEFRWTARTEGPKLTLDLRFDGLTRALEKSMAEPRARRRAG
jgi:hypothetical protein